MLQIICGKYRDGMMCSLPPTVVDTTNSLTGGASWGQHAGPCRFDLVSTEHARAISDMVREIASVAPLQWIAERECGVATTLGGQIDNVQAVRFIFADITRMPDDDIAANLERTEAP